MIAITFLIVFPSPPKSLAKEGNLPYKATTVDECIQEKECVWHAFVKQIGANDYTQWLISGRTIHKWSESIRYSYEGAGDDFKENLRDQISQIQPSIPYKIIGSKNPNVLFSYTENIENTYKRFIPSMVEALGEKRVLNFFEMIQKNADGCVTIPMIAKTSENLNTVLVIVDVNSQYSNSCVGMGLYQALGLAGYHPFKQPFSAFSAKARSKIELTKLDQFLVFLLYQPKFESGQSIEEIQLIFEEIYPSVKNHFLNIE